MIGIAGVKRRTTNRQTGGGAVHLDGQRGARQVF